MLIDIGLNPYYIYIFLVITWHENVLESAQLVKHTCFLHKNGREEGLSFSLEHLKHAIG